MGKPIELEFENMVLDKSSLRQLFLQEINTYLPG